MLAGSPGAGGGLDIDGVAGAGGGGKAGWPAVAALPGPGAVAGGRGAAVEELALLPLPDGWGAFTPAWAPAAGGLALGFEPQARSVRVSVSCGSLCDAGLGRRRRGAVSLGFAAPPRPRRISIVIHVCELSLAMSSHNEN
jgi:hypothetical protein